MNVTTGEEAGEVTEEPLIPVRMFNELTYCPRLAYLEWVQGEFTDNAETLDGRLNSTLSKYAPIPQEYSRITSWPIPRLKRRGPIEASRRCRRRPQRLRPIPRLKRRGPIEAALPTRWRPMIPVAFHG